MIGRRVAEMWAGVLRGRCLWRWGIEKRECKSVTRAVALFMIFHMERRGHGGDKWLRSQPGKCQDLSGWKFCYNLHSLFLSQILSFISTFFPLVTVPSLFPLLTQTQAGQLQML